MSLIRNVDGLDPEAVVKVDAALASIGHVHRVRIPLAIESGSRAWGFPSPDSDYDCRFLFVRPVDAIDEEFERATDRLAQIVPGRRIDAAEEADRLFKVISAQYDHSG